jgi:small GTP-binding protein
MILKSQSISLKLTDTSGSTEYDGLRPLAYQKCNVVVLCFSVNDQTSLDNIWNKWFAEVKRHAPHASILLVGLKKDLRSISHDKNNVGQDFVTESSARSLALQMGARAYLECSSRDIESVDALFEVIIELAMESQRSRTCCTML